MNIQFQPNTLYYGDCLDIMADFPEKSVDLICLDPPFNSNRKYNNIFKNSGLKTEAQIKAFDDVWHWDEASAERVQRLKNAVANPASKVIAGFEGFIPKSKMLSYTSYMAERLFVMHRILKDTGSIYLHCDPYASHYLKLVMDAIFGEQHYRNEIVWCYTGPSNTKRWFPHKHDIILFYVKSNESPFYADAVRVPYSESFINRRRYTEGQSGITAGYSEGREDAEIQSSFGSGKIIEDYWTDIPAGGAIPKNERMGYPTQKPLKLYDRIIKASSNESDLVLDPFAGCGTTVEAALINQRDVIGIDILPFALRLINEHRIKPHGREPFPMQGIPVDMDTATQLAKTAPFKFQDWAVSLINGFAANPQKVGDDGIDGFGMLFNKPDNMERKAIIVQVTGASGSQKAKYDRLHANVRNENAAMGILITLDEQNAQRNWKHTLEPVKIGASEYPPIQCFSVEEYFRYDRDPNRILQLPSLANPWTGKQMQPTLFDF
ncbi:site-specific DNA-methyltransferase [Candidatus Poribacteria bacterium]|nr:MAG: site-specific DNA-methyltransferase [Candidatus Poribacteria bacterium]